jgi:4-diphosphocytidyl-2-C-methyl-D-erythritol kinase
VNLGLRITGVRAAGPQRGYHELASVFLPIDYADSVEIALEDLPRGGPAVTLRVAGDIPGVPGDESNLAFRAAASFLEAAAAPLRARLVLHKRGAAGAGLGGGSSDAGAVLRGLAALLPGSVAREKLEGLALGLGADVPFFLDPRPAWVTGIGERRAPVPEIGPVDLVLAHPGTALATASVFRAYDEADGIAAALTRRSPPSTMPPLSGLPGQRAGSDPRDLASQLDSLLENDLEPAALRLCPAIGRLRHALRRAGALGVGLSGSGPTVFGIFADAPSARKAADGMALEPPAWCRVAARWIAPSEAV